jgi:hypothetical protein
MFAAGVRADIGEFWSGNGLSADDLSGHSSPDQYLALFSRSIGSAIDCCGASLHCGIQRGQL